MQRHYLRFLVVALLTLTAAHLPLAAQSSTSGSITGVVADETGAVIPGAEVTLLNQRTAQEVTKVTGDAGNFNFPALIPGLYTLRASQTGFKTFVATDIVVNVAEVTSLRARLELGEISSEVVVFAGAELIEKTEAKVGNTIGKLEIDKLPVNGRNPISLMRLMPGVADNRNGGLVIAGNRTSFTNISMDGVNIQDNFIRSNSTTFTPVRPTMDSVGEFTITTQNQGVENGFGSNQVQLVTPSGSNDIHGNVYWYHRNTVTTANSFFNNRTIDPTNPKCDQGEDCAVPREFLLRNQYGASGSGPVIKDRFLIWGNYEAQKIRNSNSTTATLWRPSLRNGDFSYVATDGSGIKTVNLLQIGGLNSDPIFKQFVGLTPTDGNTITGISDSLNREGKRFNQRSDNDREQWKFRGDYILNDAHSFEGTYQFLKNSDLRDDIDGTFNVVPVVTSGTGGAWSDFYSAAWKWSVSPTLLNEFRTGGFLSPVLFQPDGGGIVEPGVLAMGFYFTGLSFTNPLEDFERQGRVTNTYTWQDNASWQKGAHSIRFGFQSNLIRVNSFACFTCVPDYDLNLSGVNNRVNIDETLFPGGISAANLSTARGYLSDLAGFLSSGAQEWNITTRGGQFQAVSDDFNWEYDTYSFYFGDNWRFSPRLTLNLGLRWEWTGNLKESNDLIVQVQSQDLSTPGYSAALLNPNAVYDFIPDNLIKGDYNNFAPNVGFAWDVFGNGRTTLRAGYGISYVNDEAIRSTDTWLNREGLNATTSVTNLNNTISEGLPGFSAPNFELPLGLPTIRTRNTTGAGTFGIPNDLIVPYVQTWNVSVGRELPWDTAVEVRYLGTKGSQLRRGLDINQVGIGAGDFVSTGFFEAFLAARNNGFLSQAAGLGFDPRFNPNISGSVALPFFAQLPSGGRLTNGTVRGLIQRGEIGELANNYQANGLAGSVPFNVNPNANFADLAVNQSSSIYHAGTVEVRRRFKSGLLFNANYTFSKVFTDASGQGQTNFEPFLDINNPGYDRARAEFDLTHGFNSHFVYQLPFGAGRSTDFDSGWLNGVLGGWDVSSIFTWQSGEPFGFVSGRGTLNRGGRSGNNRANSNLSHDQLKNLFGVFHADSRTLGPCSSATPTDVANCSIYYVNPSIIGSDGRAVAADGSSPFTGQAFTNPAPGELGSLARFPFNGPQFFNWDLRLAKVFDVGGGGFTEDMKIEFQADFFNFLNNNVFNIIAATNINSTSFGQTTSSNSSARVMQFALRVNW